MLRREWLSRAGCVLVAFPAISFSKSVGSGLYDVAGNRLAETYGSHLKSDIVQMAHHGQDGVDRNVYELIQPSVCFWPTPDWLWVGELPRYKTQTVREWMSELGVKTNYVAGLLGTSAFEF